MTGTSLVGDPFCILIVTQGRWGDRIASNIRTHAPADWTVETWGAPLRLPPVVDDPDEFIPARLPAAHLVLCLGEVPGLAQLLPDLVRRSGAILRPAAQSSISLVFRNASVSASPIVSSSTAPSVTRVHPWRPQAPLSGSNAFGRRAMNSCCCSGVSFTMPWRLSPCRVAKILPFARKSGWSMCALSIAPVRPSAILRKSSGFSMRRGSHRRRRGTKALHATDSRIQRCSRTTARLM